MAIDRQLQRGIELAFEMGLLNESALRKLAEAADEVAASGPTRPAATNGRPSRRPARAGKKRGGRGRRIEIDSDELRRMNDAGYTNEQIAAHFRCSVPTVQKKKKELGIKGRRGRRKAAMDGQPGGGEEAFEKLFEKGAEKPKKKRRKKAKKKRRKKAKKG